LPWKRSMFATAPTTLMSILFDSRHSLACILAQRKYNSGPGDHMVET
jgi:hypothetical protein